MLVEAVLDLRGVDVLASAQDEVGASGDDEQRAARIAAELLVRTQRPGRSVFAVASSLRQ